MKKRTLLSMLLMLVIVMSLVGCGKDEKKPTNTVADATDAPSAEAPVTPYEPGASGPTNSTTETPEPEKNVIELLSADESKVIHEFAIPKGYTVTSDKKSNHVELICNDRDLYNTCEVKIEIYSGLNPYVLSSTYSPLSTVVKKYITDEYNYNSYACELNYGPLDDCIESLEKEIQTSKETMSENTNIDIKYFNKPVPDVYRKCLPSDVFNFKFIEYHPAYVNMMGQNGPYYSVDEHYWDNTDYTSDPYTLTYYEYIIPENNSNTSYDEHYTIKITTTFNEADYDTVHTSSTSNSLSNKMDGFSRNFETYINKFMYDANTSFNRNVHRCEYCK